MNMRSYIFGGIVFLVLMSIPNAASILALVNVANASFPNHMAYPATPYALYNGTLLNATTNTTFLPANAGSASDNVIYGITGNIGSEGGACNCSAMITQNLSINSTEPIPNVNTTMCFCPMFDTNENSSSPVSVIDTSIVLPPSGIQENATPMMAVASSQQNEFIIPPETGVWMVEICVIVGILSATYAFSIMPMYDKKRQEIWKF